MQIKILFFLLLLSLTACGGTDTSSAPISKKRIIPVELGDGRFVTNLGEPENIVIREQTAWSKLLLEKRANISPTVAMPAIDFDRQMVIGIFLGGYPSSCYSIVLVSVMQEGEQTKVTYQVNPPQPSQVCAQVIVYPSKLIAVPKKSGEVLFIDLSKNI